MKVFISWSGEPSRSIAQALAKWLSVVVQHVDPWMSDDEIRSGVRWSENVAEALEATDFGIVCVTRANQEAPWLMFESGALAKRLRTARLVPLCIDLLPSEITSPIKAFQGRQLNQEGVRRLVVELSELAPNPRHRMDVESLFEGMWPALEARIDAARKAPVAAPRVRRTQDDMLDEIVTRLRGLERDAAVPPSTELTAKDVKRLERSVDALRDALGRMTTRREGSPRPPRTKPADRAQPQPLAPTRDTALSAGSDDFLLAGGQAVRHIAYGDGVVREVRRSRHSLPAVLVSFGDTEKWVTANSLRRARQVRSG